MQDDIPYPWTSPEEHNPCLCLIEFEIRDLQIHPIQVHIPVS